MPLPSDSLTTGSHASNRAGLGLCWCRFPTLSPKPHTGPHRGEFGFSPQNEFTPPPKGGGAGYRLLFGSSGFFTQRSPVLFRRKRRILRIRWLLYAVACGNCWSQTAHTPPTAPVWGCAGVRSPTRHPKPHTGSHRAEFGFHRLFLVCFFCGNPASWHSRW